MIKIITIGAAAAKENRYVKKKDRDLEPYAPWITAVNRITSYTAVIQSAPISAIFLEVFIYTSLKEENRDG